MAPKSKSRHRANFVYEHGKAVLCSNNHQKATMRYGKEDNLIAERLKSTSRSFLQSLEWRKLRALVVKTYGRRCMKCGTTPKNPKFTHVDHIRCRKKFPELALDFDNLQVLCCSCNKHKGNKNSIDYRGKHDTTIIRNGIRQILASMA
jgi:5-methylcytosine-specific restriction endonuclease McrA